MSQGSALSSHSSSQEEIPDSNKAAAGILDQSKEQGSSQSIQNTTILQKPISNVFSFGTTPPISPQNAPAAPSNQQKITFKPGTTSLFVNAPASFGKFNAPPQVTSIFSNAQPNVAPTPQPTNFTFQPPTSPPNPFVFVQPAPAAPEPTKDDFQNLGYYKGRGTLAGFNVCCITYGEQCSQISKEQLRWKYIKEKNPNGFKEETTMKWNPSKQSDFKESVNKDQQIGQTDDGLGQSAPTIFQQGFVFGNSPPRPIPNQSPFFQSSNSIPQPVFGSTNPSPPPTLFANPPPPFFPNPSPSPLFPTSSTQVFNPKSTGVTLPHSSSPSFVPPASPVPSPSSMLTLRFNLTNSLFASDDAVLNIDSSWKPTVTCLKQGIVSISCYNGFKLTMEYQNNQPAHHQMLGSQPSGVNQGVFGSVHPQVNTQSQQNTVPQNAGVFNNQANNSSQSNNVYGYTNGQHNFLIQQRQQAQQQQQPQTNIFASSQPNSRPSSNVFATNSPPQPTQTQQRPTSIFPIFNNSAASQTGQSPTPTDIFKN